MKSYYVTNRQGQRIEGNDGHTSGSYAYAKSIADRLREEAVKAGKLALHYHVVEISTVYVTSTLDDVLEEK